MQNTVTPGGRKGCAIQPTEFPQRRVAGP
ncbi:MAG TPA: IS66 family insertion sequence hypothetical protein, partial [Escherichia coli]|nr:IS66 family insertion sequence hypothetical protein [Escherichia coli]